MVSGRCKFAERTFLGFMKWTLGWRFGNSTCKGKFVSLYGFYGEVTSLPKREIMALSSSLLSFHFRSSIFHFDFDPFFLFLFIASNLRVYSTLILRSVNLAICINTINHNPPAPWCRAIPYITILSRPRLTSLHSSVALIQLRARYHGAYILFSTPSLTTSLYLLGFGLLLAYIPLTSYLST